MEMIVLLAILLLIFVSVVLSVIQWRKNKNPDSGMLSEKIDKYETKLDSYEKNLKDEFERNRKETSESSAASRKENTDTLVSFQNAINDKFDSMTKNTHDSLTNSLTKFMDTLSSRLDSLAKTTQETLNSQQQTVQNSLKSIQDSNERKLEQMRATVDEKLQSTLEKRLEGSFRLVSNQLEAVQKGLGEMQNLASDVGGLKRALTNVKTAGGIGEVQLEALLNEILSPEQFVKNAHPNPKNSKKVVEFAVKIPSKTESGESVLLPIDSKYPAEVWDKLSKAYEEADKEKIDKLKKDLVSDIKKMSKDIKEKYIETPYTTDFGLLFVPFESLFSEIMRIPGLFQEMQNTHKVTIAGPTTLGAFLSSLQMGFRTLAIQKETSKIWDLLSSVKSEFGKFGDILAATKKKLESATSEIENAEKRSRQIERKLTKIDTIPERDETAKFLEETEDER